MPPGVPDYCGRANTSQDREFLLSRDRGGKIPESIGPLYAGRRLRSGKHPEAYSNVIYHKGGWVLHMLRMLLDDFRKPQDRDHRFIAMMKDFTKSYFNRPASTEDFKAVLERHMTPQMDFDGNGTMDWFFDSWVYGTGIPEYKLDYRIEPSGQPEQFILTGSLRQSEVREGFQSIVALYFHQGKRLMRSFLKVSGPEAEFRIPLGFKPDKVTINDWQDVLCRDD